MPQRYFNGAASWRNM